MKRTNSSCQNIALVAMVVLLCLFGANPSVFAQEKVNGKYKVGDRVGCDFNYNGEYKSGTVVEAFEPGSALACCRYRVKIDDEKNDPLWKDGRNCFERNMRAIGGVGNENQTGNEPPKTPTEKPARNPKPDEPKDFTYLADREILECPVEQTQVKNGAKPNTELLKKIIRCLYERRAPAGITGAKTVDVSAFVIGTPRRWRPLDDIGSGNTNTTVYPIKVTWTLKTFYESFTQVIDSISIFNCYVNAVGEWECGLGQRLKDSDIKRIPRQQ